MNRPDPLPLPPACAAARDRWQCRFDAAPADEPPPADAHTADCPDCRDWATAARRLLDGVARLRAPLPPIDLADRLVGRVLRDQRRRRLTRRAFAVTALAAGVLLAVWVGLPAREGQHLAGPELVQQPPPPAPPPPAEPAPPSLRDALAQSGSDVMALARRTADEAVGPTRLFVPKALEAPPTPAEPWQPAAESLQDVRQGAVASFEPVASSAKRAANLFWRELPPVQ